MEGPNKYVIEGKLKCAQEVDWSQVHMVVRALVQGCEVAQSPVNKKGAYKLSFEFHGEPPSTELQVLPAALKCRDRGLALAKTLSPYRYVARKNSPLIYHADYDLLVPGDYILAVNKVTKTYVLHGTVYATTFADVGGVPTPISIDPLPAARIEFYEVDTPFIWILGTDPLETESSLGYAYTDPNGAYTFSFSFSYSLSPWVGYLFFTDTVPDIRARISQMIGGVWTEIYAGSVDWNIVQDFHRDFFVDIEDVLPVPDWGVKPTEGFRFSSVGLLPIDATRIVEGYATSQAGDPVSLSQQPFCSTLRIFGLFAAAPPVATYKVEIAPASATAVTGAWEAVTDSLTNNTWNATLHKWDPVGLGPDPVTGRYTNIDTQPEADWHEHALKVTWNTANYADGYYGLRVTGYDAANVLVGTYEMPIMRIDNSIPTASIEAVLPAPSICGMLTLAAARTITFKITAHDAEGHVLSYSLSGTRGKDAGSAGTTISESRPDPTDTWTGRQNHNVAFAVAAVPLALSGCPAMAYNFELHVYGSPTNGYASWVEAQHVEKETNLVVAEPAP